MKKRVSGKRRISLSARGLTGRRPSPDPAADHRTNILNEIRKRSGSLAHDLDVPKHARLRNAILAGLKDGLLKPGAQLPPEQVIANALGLSHGTVRRTMQQLEVGGIVTREHGRGTFVAKQHVLDEIWHLRFHDEDVHKVLPIYARILERCVTHGDGPWTDALGNDSEGYVVIRRSYDVDHRFVCYTEFYLQASGFGEMATRRLRDLESTNLKRYINEHYGFPTLYATQRVRLEVLDPRTCKIMSVKRATVGLLLEVVSYTYGDAPLSFHLIHIPPTKYMLDLSMRGLSSRVPPAGDSDISPDVQSYVRA